MEDGTGPVSIHAADRVVAVSKAVSGALTTGFNVSADKIDLVYGFVPEREWLRHDIAARRRELRARLGWPEDAFVVGGCGSLGWRKGTDVFIQIANASRRLACCGKMRFLWIGGPPHGMETLEFMQDVRLLGLENLVHREAVTADVAEYYGAMDAFALTSREDPFPLVVLEAAQADLPIVCFAGAGGAPEFVGDDAGLVAPYLDIPAFLAHLHRLQEDNLVRTSLGKCAGHKARIQHSVDAQAPKLATAILKCLPHQRSRGQLEARVLDA